MISSNPYETDAFLSQYLSSFYFDNETNPFFSPSLCIEMDYSKDYLTSLSEYSMAAFQKYSKKCNSTPLKALDIGCGVGRLAFELSVKFDSILAIDYSDRFVKTCEILKKDGFIEYQRTKCGELVEKRIAKVPLHAKRERVEFQRGDAQNLGPIGTFDLIVASNLIDRLENPEKFLNSIPAMLNEDGLLVITSPYSWLPNYTEKDKWIGGKDGQETFEALRLHMKKIGFDFCEQKTFKMFMANHERAFHLGLPHATVWIKTS